MRTRRYFLLFVSVLSLTLLLGARDDEGCGQGLDNRAGEPGIDVGGPAGAEWDVAYDKNMVVDVIQGGAVIGTKNVVVATGGTIDVAGVQVDLNKLCDRPDVACPQEVFPTVVRMTQPGVDRHLLYVTFNKTGPMGNINDQYLVGNVDSDKDFSIFLGISAAAAGTCGLLGTSYATGHIYNPTDPARGTKLEGNVITEYSGGCVVATSGGGGAAGITVRLKVLFVADRR